MFGFIVTDYFDSLTIKKMYATDYSLESIQ